MAESTYPAATAEDWNRGWVAGVDRAPSGLLAIVSGDGGGALDLTMGKMLP